MSALASQKLTQKQRMLTEPFVVPAFLRYLDVPRLISWLSSRQYAPEGGFSGRTNKLVDGCYSHWVGGCWPLIEATLSGSGVSPQQPVRKEKLPAHQQSLYSREGLIRYTMCCCQDRSKRGGLRDKPGKYVGKNSVLMKFTMLTFDTADILVTI